MSDEFDEDYNEFFNRIKKLLRIDPDKFDFDIIFLPESELRKDYVPNDENLKAFKVNYHFEKGMDKPKIKIEGDIDNEKLRKYFKNLDINNYPQFKSFIRRGNKKYLKNGSITLQPREEEFNFENKDLYYEINSTGTGIEIILEAPGVEKGHVILSLSEDSKNLKIIIQNMFKEFEKVINLPFESTLKNHNLEVNNGIITIQIKKKKYLKQKIDKTDKEGDNT